MTRTVRPAGARPSPDGIDAHQTSPRRRPRDGLAGRRRGQRSRPWVPVQTAASLLSTLPVGDPQPTPSATLPKLRTPLGDPPVVAVGVEHSEVLQPPRANRQVLEDGPAGGSDSASIGIDVVDFEDQLDADRRSPLPRDRAPDRRRRRRGAPAPARARGTDARRCARLARHGIPAPRRRTPRSRPTRPGRSRTAKSRSRSHTARAAVTDALRDVRLEEPLRLGPLQ